MGYFYMPLVVWFVLLVVNFWSERYWQNHCPLAADFGTKACRFAVGVWLCIGDSSCWGGILCIFLLSDAVFLCYRDIFSVTKLTYSFQLLLVALALMLHFHILQLGLKNKLAFVMNSVLNLLRFVLVGWGRVLFSVTVDFNFLFLTYLYIYDVW